MDEDDTETSIIDGLLKDWRKNSFSKECFSMVVIRDHSSATSSDTTAHHAVSGEDLTIFPPSNHENLLPSSFNSDPKYFPSSPMSPLSFPQSDFEDPPPSPTPPPPPPPQPPVTLLPQWWSLAFEILRSRIGNVGLFFGCSTGKRSPSFWSFKNVAFVATVVLWWFSVRLRRRRRTRKSVEHLMEIVNEKDKKIMELLNQVAQMNEVLLSRHKVLASKLPN
ncbi:uncharacterized protein LOC130015364 [Mercurialis annua]|uniref:uncharacterized protein LOC130015364 n=1 Tax=Mercurialis annua TaxID=3986 RepID=UPI0024ACB9FE|nr:uncharacterized protein LOC130015364 [Mercurialis annua]